MRIESLQTIFPDNPELVEAIWTKGADQMEVYEVVAKVVEQPEKTFLPIFFEALQKSISLGRNPGYIKKIVLKLQGASEFPQYAQLAKSIVFPKIPKLRADDNYGLYPDDSVSLSGMKDRATVLRENDFAKAKQIISLLNSDFAHDSTISKTAEAFWNDVDTPLGYFRLGSCPEKDSSDEFGRVSLLFQGAINDGIRLLVCLNETGESAKIGVPDFWENRVLWHLNIPGWKIEKTGEIELASVPKDRQDYNTPRVVKSVLEAREETTGRIIPMTVFHMDGWRDQSPMPGKSPILFNALQMAIREHRSTLKERVWINCIGGIGRTGTTAAGICAMEYIDQELGKKTPFDQIKPNFPQIIYSLRKSGCKLVGQPSHLHDLHAWLGLVFDQHAT